MARRAKGKPADSTPAPDAPPAQPASSTFSDARIGFILRQLDPDTLAVLRARAAHNKRSILAEARVALRRAAKRFGR